LNNPGNHITDDLLVKYLLGEADPEEAEAVNLWVSQSPDNRTYLDQLRQVWEMSRKLALESTVDETAAWQRFKARVGREKAPAGRPRQFAGWMRIAALFLLIAGAALLFYFSNREVPVQHLTARANQEIISDTLSDGTVVTLNKNSSLSYPDRFVGNQRLVALKGEAFFSVAPNKDKPFLITVNEVTVKVIGTSFNIRSENGTTEVIVESGVVQVIRKDQVLQLKPKEKAVVKKDSTMYKAEETERLYNYYRTREFVCDNTPLWKLVAVLNEAYGANVIIGRDALRNMPLTTTFNNESLDRILDIIRTTFDITVVRQNNTIILQ
jgi:ferric-dicitrate binding protein FerR (iron transport regulator)